MFEIDPIIQLLGPECKRVSSHQLLVLFTGDNKNPKHTEKK